jgi:hypothetical protein
MSENKLLFQRLIIRGDFRVNLTLNQVRIFDIVRPVFFD